MVNYKISDYKKINLAVLFGGQSTEHNISILSAKNIIAALDQNRYHIHCIYITEQGEWYYINEIFYHDLHQHPKELISQGLAQRILLAPGDSRGSFTWYDYDSEKHILEIDCVFPIIHGTLGEDGALQGLLEILGLPYVGSEVLSSAICMNKHIAKQLLRANGIHTTDWLMINNENRYELSFSSVTKQLGSPLFIKPADLGSSVGMSKILDEQQFQEGLQEAFQYSETVIIESYVGGREIECAVLGNQNPQASVLGEIIPHLDFYDYAAKYLEPEGQGATLVTPALLEEDLIQKFQEIAVSAYKILHCQGMARVDFFLVEQAGERQILLNEVNTIPGFTNISMYPRLWHHCGIHYSQLLDQLIELALTRQQSQHALTRIYRHPSTESVSTF